MERLSIFKTVGWANLCLVALHLWLHWPVWVSHSVGSFEKDATSLVPWLEPLQERFAKKNEASDLLRAFHDMDTKKDNKIDADELMQLFARLGHKLKRVMALIIRHQELRGAIHCL